MGRYSREKGIRFERSIARKFRAAGFECQRILEYDGFNTGCDLRIGRPLPRRNPDDLVLWESSNPQIEWLPVALQCKAVNNPNAWKAGLEEAKKAMPDAQVWACIHSYKGQIMVYLKKPISGPLGIYEFIVWLHNKYLA